MSSPSVAECSLTLTSRKKSCVPYSARTKPLLFGTFSATEAWISNQSRSALRQVALCTQATPTTLATYPTRVLRPPALRGPLLVPHLHKQGNVVLVRKTPRVLTGRALMPDLGDSSVGKTLRGGFHERNSRRYLGTSSSARVLLGGPGRFSPLLLLRALSSSLWNFSTVLTFTET